MSSDKSSLPAQAHKAALARKGAYPLKCQLFYLLKDTLIYLMSSF